MEIPLGTEVEGYTFLAKIGAGAFSRVYRVKSARFGTEFAAKVLLPDDDRSSARRTSYEIELSALKNLSHPNIILLFGTFTYLGCPVLVFEFCPRGSLYDEIEANSGRGLTLNRFASIAWQTLDALHYCHSQNTSHCDIKPQNILIDEHGRPKLADFGIAQCFAHPWIESPMGTLAYTAPELFLGGERDRQPADIWALGVTFAYLLDGRLPWPSDLSKRRDAIMNGRFDIERHLPSALRHLLRKMIDVDPKTRWTAERLKHHEFFNGFSRNEPVDGTLITPMRRSSLPGMKPFGTASASARPGRAGRICFPRVIFRKSPLEGPV
jgi:serine/threonine protein kinase